MGLSASTLESGQKETQNMIRMHQKGTGIGVTRDWKVPEERSK